MDRPLKAQRGFSLLECLIVVALIGILTLISMGQYAGVTAAASRDRAKVCVSQIALEVARRALRDDSAVAEAEVPELACVQQLSPKDYVFTLTVGEGDGPSWAVVAQPQRERIQSLPCSRMQLDESGSWAFPGSREGACR